MVEFWVWLYLQQQRGCNLCHPRAISFTRDSSKLYNTLGRSRLFLLLYIFSTKGVIQRKCSRVRNSIFVNIPYSIGKPPVIPNLTTSFNINDPHFLSTSEIRFNICKYQNSNTKNSCTFITFLNMLHFYNSKNRKKSTIKNVALL